jgi:hypothetical protein
MSSNHLINMNKNTKIAIALLGLAGIFLAYKKGLFTKKSDSERGMNPDAGTNPPDSGLPIVQTSSSSETPQVIDTKLPPQFTESVVTATVPNVPGSYQSYQS